MVARVRTEPTKGLVHAAVSPFCDDALGLFNDDATSEGIIELLVECVGVERCAVLEYGNRRHVGKSLGRGDVFVSHRALQSSKEIERTDGAAAKSQRKAVYRVKSVLNRSGREERPAPVRFAEGNVNHGRTAAETVHARTFVRLDLEELQYSNRFARRRHKLQLSSGQGQQDSRGVYVQGFDAAIAQQSENLNDVKVIDEIVGQFDERVDY